MTIKNSGRNISAEPGDIVLDVTSNTLTKQDNNSNFSNNLILTIKQQDFINDANQSHTKTLTIPMSEVVRLAYLQNNYYTKTQSDTRYNATVEKQTTPDSGFAASYIVKQNGKQVGTKINIPKDLLLQSAELKTVGTTPTQEETNAGLKAKQKYILFIVNTQDNDAPKRLLLSVNDLVDTYTADEKTLTLVNNQFKVKDGGITSTQLASALNTTINNKVDKVSGKGLSTNDYTTADKNKLNNMEGDLKEYVDEEILNILDPSGEIKLSIASKADADHDHGNIKNNGTITNSNVTTLNGILATNTSNKIIAVPTIKKDKISDFSHTHKTSEIIEASALANIGSAANDTQHTVNTKINTSLGKKVDKISGKTLTSNDFTDTLLDKLEHIAEEANKYVHPTQTGAPFIGYPATSLFPKFGDIIQLSQVETDKYGHVSKLIDRDIVLPNILASDEEPGLMSKSDYTKLYNIEKQATKTTASTTSPKMNGTVAVGNELTTFARGDHVHPTDTTRAPNKHAVSGETYGVSSETVYGHAKATSTTPKDLATSASLGTETKTFARGDHVHKLPPDATINNKGLMTPAYVNKITTMEENISLNANDINKLKTVESPYVHSAFSVYKVGRIVWFIVTDWDWNLDGYTNYGTLENINLTLDEKYRPIQHVYVANVSNPGLRLRIYSSGVIKGVRDSSSAPTRMNASATWFTNG